MTTPVPDTKQALQLALDALENTGWSGTRSDLDRINAAVSALQSALQQQETRASTQAVTAILVNELVEQGKFFERGDISEAEFIAAVNHYVDQFAGGVVAQQETREPVAWMHEEDPTRVINAPRKAQALRDGGIYAASVKLYSVPLYASPIPQQDARPCGLAQCPAGECCKSPDCQNLPSFNRIAGVSVPQQDADALDGPQPGIHAVWLLEQRIGEHPAYFQHLGWDARGYTFPRWTRLWERAAMFHQREAAEEVLSTLRRFPVLDADNAHDGWRAVAHEVECAAMRAGQEGEARDAD